MKRPSFRVALAALSMVVVACGSAQDGDAPAAGEPAAESASPSPRQTWITAPVYRPPAPPTSACR